MVCQINSLTFEIWQLLKSCQICPFLSKEIYLTNHWSPCSILSAQTFRRRPSFNRTAALSLSPKHLSFSARSRYASAYSLILLIFSWKVISSPPSLWTFSAWINTKSLLSFHPVPMLRSLSLPKCARECRSDVSHPVCDHSPVTRDAKRPEGIPTRSVGTRWINFFTFF